MKGFKCELRKLILCSSASRQVERRCKGNCRSRLPLETRLVSRHPLPPPSSSSTYWHMQHYTQTRIRTHVKVRIAQEQQPRGQLGEYHQPSRSQVILTCAASRPPSIAHPFAHIRTYAPLRHTWPPTQLRTFARVHCNCAHAPIHT